MTNAPGPYRRRYGLSVTRVDDDAFVVIPNSEEVLHLNGTGRALWDLLAEPATAAELAALLAEAFPDQPRARIDDDVAAFLARLEASGLIAPVSGPA